MTLAQVVDKVRKPIMDAVQPDLEMLKCFAQMVELNYFEWSKIPDNDLGNQKWADFLIPKAKQQGWIRLCVEHQLLRENWLKWPHHNVLYPPRLKATKEGGKSLRTIPGGAIEQNRRKH